MQAIPSPALLPDGNRIPPQRTLAQGTTGVPEFSEFSEIQLLPPEAGRRVVSCQAAQSQTCFAIAGRELPDCPADKIHLRPSVQYISPNR